MRTTLRFSVRGGCTRLACAAGCSAVRTSEFASSAVASSNPVRTTFMNGSLANDLLAPIALRLIHREIEQKPSAKSQSPTDAGKEVSGVPPEESLGHPRHRSTVRVRRTRDPKPCREGPLRGLSRPGLGPTP